MPKRVRETSSSEESYASPVTQFPSHGLPSPPFSSDGRARRTRGSSSDEDPIVGDMINEDYRSGGPLLAALPCRTVPLSMDNPAAIVWQSDTSFARSVVDMLQRHNVDVKSVELFGRQSEDAHDPDSGRAVETVVVSAKKAQFDNSWVSACFDIHNFFLQKGLKNLNIEIIDGRAWVKKFASPVPSSHPIYTSWYDIATRIIYKIGRKGWLALECFQWGEDSDPSLNDGSQNPVTVILTIPHDSEKGWKHPREQIVSVLTDFKLHDVAVSILRGKIWRGATVNPVVLSNNAWERKSQLGMSIGPSNSDLSASTLGPLIELKLPDGKWMCFGLTCFHSVIAGKKEEDMSLSELECHRIWEQKGIHPNDNRAGNLKMDLPSLRDHKHQLNCLNRDINEFDNDPDILETQNKIKKGGFVMPTEMKRYEFSTKNQTERLNFRSTLQDFFPNEAYFGQVFSASGIRRTNEHQPSQLDWALVEIVGRRLGKNKIPPAGERHGANYIFDGGLLARPFVEKIPERHKLFKIGRTTDFTVGEFHGLRSTLLMSSGEVDQKGDPVNIETWEYAITGLGDKRFSEKGDSGAAVFDNNNQFIGLLFAGGENTNATYFTPWERLVADIKHITGASDVRIPVDS